MPKDESPPPEDSEEEVPTGRWSTAISDLDLPDGDSRRLVEPGTMVDHFKVVRLVGRGGMGEVYLARDTRLGRKVALKVIHPAQMGSRQATERFLFEARTTARFSHPNIVTIHAVGEFQQRPYVALEYLEGQTLRERIDFETISTREAMRYGLSITDALAEAHRNGVLHRDLKPENVLIPPDGRLRVVDFGLAQMVRSAERDPEPPQAVVHQLETSAPFESEGRHIRGTPAYMSPEQWDGRPPTDATDIWALGVMLYEILTGHRPYHDIESSMVTMVMKVTGPEPVPGHAALRKVSKELGELVMGCLQKTPEERPGAADIRNTFRTLLASGRERHSDEESPFRGLRPFTERHADFFFGRGDEVGVFLERIREETVLPVVGPSGAGKSSFVQAGVIPRLREQASWTVLAMRPGGDPFLTLATRLVSGETTARKRLRTSKKKPKPALSRVITRKISDPIQRQIESRTTLDEEAQAMSSVDPRPKPSDAASLARQLADSPGLLGVQLQQLAEREFCRVLLFVDQLEELYTLVDDEQARQRFMRAICTAADDPMGPVRVVFTLRDDFLGRLAEGPEARAALSHVTVIRSPGAGALREILTRPLREPGYEYDDPDLVDEMVADVAGEPACLPLLQFTLRTLWDRRDKQARRLRRATYQELGGVAGALAEHADGVLEGLSPSQVRLAREIFLRMVTADGTRKVLSVRQTLDGLGPDAEVVLDRLTGSRLVSVGKGRGQDATLELVHESLIRSWTQLSHWIDESREELAFLAEIGQAADLWAKRGRHPEEVWHGEALREALRILKRVTSPLPRPITAFLEAGKERQRRTRRGKRQRLIVGWSLLLAVAVVSTFVALGFARKEHQARQRWAEAQREGARAALMRGDLLEARARLRGSLETEDSPLARALWWQLQQEPLVWKKTLGAYIYDGALSPDGRTIAAASLDRSVYLVDVQTRQVIRILRGHEDQVYSVAFSPDGALLASATRGGHVQIWDPATGERLRELPPHQDRSRDLTFSPDGAYLAAGSFDGGSFPVWDTATGQLIRLFDGHEGPVRGIAFSPDGTRLATTSDDGSARLWDVQTGAEQAILLGHTGNVVGVKFSPDGRLLATGGDDGRIITWDTATGDIQRNWSAHESSVVSLDVSPDGDLLASGGNDQAIHVWKAATGKRIRRYPGHSGGVNSLSFDVTGEQLISWSADQSIRIWSLDYRLKPSHTGGHRAWIMSGAFSPDGTVLATSSADHGILLWDVATGRVAEALEGHTAEASAIVFTPDGSRAVSGSWDWTIKVWDLRTGDVVQTMEGHNGWIRDLAVSPDGRFLVSGSRDSTGSIWDLETGQRRFLLEGHQGSLLGVAYSPDGTMVATGGTDRLVKLWDAHSGTLLRTLEGHDSPVRGVAFSPDGRHVASAGMDQTVRIWALDGGDTRVLRGHQGAVYSVEWHPDGRHLGTPGADGTARIWDLEDGSAVELLGHRGEVNFVRFSPDGKLAATGSDDGTVRIWDASTGAPVWRAPLMLDDPPRLLTHNGWLPLGDSVTAAGAWGTSQWEDAVEHKARAASLAEDLLCLHTWADDLEIWDLPSDRLLSSHPTGSVHQVLALPGGCVVVSGEAARLHPREGAQVEFPVVTNSIARDGEHLLIASGRQVLRFDATGQELATYDADIGVTAIYRTDEFLMLGFQEGDVQFIPMADAEIPPPLEDIPSSPVVSLLEGPMGTLVVGYANGLLGIWDLYNGTRLEQARLHGPISHLTLTEGHLYAATELGDHVVLDLGVFYQDYCDLVRSVWESVPVVWSSGVVESRPSPDDHDCFIE